MKLSDVAIPMKSSGISGSGVDMLGVLLHNPALKKYKFQYIIETLTYSQILFIFKVWSPLHNNIASISFVISNLIPYEFVGEELAKHLTGVLSTAGALAEVTFYADSEYNTYKMNAFGAVVKG